MGRISKKLSEEKPRWAMTPEELDHDDGWFIYRRFRNKTEMALFVNEPGNIVDLDCSYPIEIYRRKLDIDNNYIALLRR
jgi:hypothetical protein